MIPCCPCAPPPPTDASYLLDREERRVRDNARAHWGHLLPAQHPSAFDLANARIVAFAANLPASWRWNPPPTTCACAIST